MLTVRQAAELCGLKPVTIRAWIAQGKLRRTNGLINMADLLACHDSRNPRMLAVRAGTSPKPDLVTAGHIV